MSAVQCLRCGTWDLPGEHQCPYQAAEPTENVVVGVLKLIGGFFRWILLNLVVMAAILAAFIVLGLIAKLIGLG